jgi:hypothetical protein
MEKYIIVADWEDMKSEIEQPKQHGLQIFEGTHLEFLAHKDHFIKNYWEHGYSNFSIEQIDGFEEPEDNEPFSEENQIACGKYEYDSGV